MQWLERLLELEFRGISYVSSFPTPFLTPFLSHFLSHFLLAFFVFFFKGVVGLVCFYLLHAIRIRMVKAGGLGSVYILFDERGGEREWKDGLGCGMSVGSGAVHIYLDDAGGGAGSAYLLYGRGCRIKYIKVADTHGFRCDGRRWRSVG